MNRKRILWLGLLLFAIFAFISVSASVPDDVEKCVTCRANLASEACTVIIVGKNASVDGSVMSTHTCDCGVCDWTFRCVPAADWPAGSTRKIYHIDQFFAFPPDVGLKWEKIKDNFSGLEIPQPANTFGYITATSAI